MSKCVKVNNEGNVDMLFVKGVSLVSVPNLASLYQKTRYDVPQSFVAVAWFG